MRYGENPLEVTRRVKEKITTLQAGLPEGVRIVPFYDRTPLIHKALETVSGTVKEELIVCTVAILLVMGHLGSAFVVAVTLPLAILFSFLMMRLLRHLVEHHEPGRDRDLGRHPGRPGGRDGRERGAPPDAPLRPGGSRGDTTEIVIPACRTVGRPIFFSVLITILSFLPVFALRAARGRCSTPGLHQDVRPGRRGAPVDHAGAGADPDLPQGPDQVGGRELAGPDDDRDLQADALVADGPDRRWSAGCSSCILGLGYVASTQLGREFMPDLDEGSIMDMPTTVPRASVPRRATTSRPATRCSAASPRSGRSSARRAGPRRRPTRRRST